MINVEFFKSKIAETGLSKTEFAKQCGISVYLLNSLIKGKGIIKASPLIKVCRFLKISADDLLDISIVPN